ncbi:MAG: RsmD family RNA methyltransferase, partial [Thermoguttaceae bacterium]|nr:RsmD family RNA methyltransferase [Thermoguttaceae bacterium]
MRVVGGKFRGTKLEYGGDRRVRPMKERVREAIFNLLGTSVAGRHVVDLFAG